LDILSAAVCIFLASPTYFADFSSLAGARQVATGLNIAKQTNSRVFVTSMCIGSGMGMAAIFVSEH
jgi:Thiolase, C-terminal domain